jgi:alpha-beta hydrolase superfamily lysophospholipase
MDNGLPRDIPSSDESVVDSPASLKVLFHPRKENANALLSDGTLKVTIEVEPNIKLGGRLHKASAAAPVILFFHGNGEIAADYDKIGSFYTRRDMHILVVDYRGYGTSDGTPTMSKMLGDAIVIQQSLDKVFEDHGIRPSGIFVMGRSLGSAPAIEVAVNAPPGRLSGLIIDSGFAETSVLLERLGAPTESQIPDRHNNISKMKRLQVPLLIIHGDLDSLIPSSEASRLLEHANCDEKELLLIHGAGHNSLLCMGMNLYFDAIERFVKRGDQA